MLNRHLLLQTNSRLFTSVAPTLSSVCRRDSSTSTFQNEDDDDAPALSAISTATAISRTLRKYREAATSSSSSKNKNSSTSTMNMNNNNNNDWVDLEKLLSSKYLSRMDMEEQSTNAPILRPLQISEEILAGSTAFKQAGLELKPQLLVRLRRPATAANVFVDTDGLLPSDLVDVFTSSSSIRILPDHSTITCVRHATNTNPSVRNFGHKLCELAQLNPIRYSVGEDIICSGGNNTNSTSSSSSALREDSNIATTTLLNDQSDDQQHNDNNNNDETLYVSRHFNNNTNDSTGAHKFSSTSLLRSFHTSNSNSTSPGNNNNATTTTSSLVKNYMFVEKLAAQLHASHTVVLHDVIYVCSDENFALYRDHVSKATEFLDADVFVVSPNHYKKVYSKTAVPVVSPTVV